MGLWFLMGKMALRPYQQAAKEAVFEKWSAGTKRTLLVLPTGTGKTIVFASVTEACVRHGERVLILAHRGELLEQASDKIKKSTGLGCAVEKADQTCKGSWYRVVVGSVQTLMRDKRLSGFPRDYFETIVVDEAHHCISDSYQKVLQYFSDAKVLGVTATPDRGDMKDLGTYFENIAYEYTLPKAIREGYLSPIKALTIPLKIDISGVGIQTGDFKTGELGTALDPYLEQIASEMEKHCSNRKTVVFLPLMKTSQKFRDILNQHGFRAAEVNGNSEDRSQILKDYDEDKYNVLCNSMLLTEGWDCPSVDCIVVLRPTKVRSLYCQMVGRGTRLAVLMFSGGKSVHAIVRIDAADYKEYQKRVEYLYQICEKNGLKVDTQNKNPSRLSRLPGCIRGDKKQFIIDTNIGKSSWTEWQEWIEAVNDNLPDIEDLSAVWNDMPNLAEPLIKGILRKGHKMLIAGPSKAGKSFLQIELCIAIAEGRKWLGRSCTQGHVMYVNLELDRASCLHRFKDVYQALGWNPKGLHNIDIWNLRGKAVPMDKLVPKLIRRAQKKDYTAIIIDPIYKVITGDENSAEQMAKFCNQFDKICSELGCATIYCHHHSKGSQGSKRSMDRASGSGVFARDPDAQLDMIELSVPDAMRKQEDNKAICRTIRMYLDAIHWDWQEDLSDDDLLNAKSMMAYCENALPEWRMTELRKLIEDAQERMRQRTAWRLEATLREFQGFEPVNVWFDYPVHRMDESGALGDIEPDDQLSPKDLAIQKRKRQAEKDRTKKRNEFEIEFSNLELEGKEVAAQELAERLKTNSKELLAWFGNGQRQKKNLKCDFEKYSGEDGKIYIRRKVQEGEQN